MRHLIFRRTTVWLGGLTIAGVAFLLMLTLLQSGRGRIAVAEDNCQTFETGYSVCGRFLSYWQSHGGLAQQGYPISQVFEEKNADPPSGDGKLHKVQYFQRARFEEHSENPYPYDVLLGLLGSEQFRTHYGAPDPNAQLFVVRNSYYASSILDHKPKEGYRYFVVDVLATNTTAKKMVVSPASVTLRTVAIYDYKVSEAMYALDKSLKLITLDFNQNVGGLLVYEIPTNETPKSITLDYFDNKATISF